MTQLIGNIGMQYERGTKLGPRSSNSLAMGKIVGKLLTSVGKHMI